MVVDDRRVDAPRVAYFQGVQVRLERVPEQDRGGGDGEHGEDVRLDLVERRGGGLEGLGGDAGPAGEVVRDGFRGLDELVVDDDPGGVVYDADARELLAVFCKALEGTTRIGIRKGDNGSKDTYHLAVNRVYSRRLASARRWGQ